MSEWKARCKEMEMAEPESTTGGKDTEPWAGSSSSENPGTSSSTRRLSPTFRWWLATAFAAVICLGALLLGQWALRSQEKALLEAGWQVYSVREAVSSVHTIYKIVTDRKGHIWVGTNNGVQVFDGDKWTSYLSDWVNSWPPVSAMAVDASDRVWVDSNFGLYVIDAGKTDWVATSSSGFAVDSDGKVWGDCPNPLGWSSTKYCDLVNKEKESSIDRPYGSHALAFDPAGHLWVSVDLEQVAVYDGEEWQTHQPMAHLFIHSIAFDRERQPWVSGWYTRGECCRLGQYDGEQWLVHQVPFSAQLSQPQTSQSRRDDDWVDALAFDDQGRLWLAISSHASYQQVDTGLAMYDGRSWTFFETADIPDALSGSGGDVRALHIDEQERLWIGVGPVLASLDLRAGLPVADPVSDGVLELRIVNQNLMWIAAVSTLLLGMIATWNTLRRSGRDRIRPWLAPALSTLTFFGCAVTPLFGGGMNLAIFCALVEAGALTTTVVWALKTEDTYHRRGRWLVPLLSGVSLLAWVVFCFLCWQGPTSNLTQGYLRPDIGMLLGGAVYWGPICFVLGIGSGLLIYRGARAANRKRTPTSLALGILALLVGIIVWAGALFILFWGFGMLATG